MSGEVSGERRIKARPIVIAGPTASGKTAAALELAKRIGAEIVSADSMAIYRGMDVGTAKPRPDERRNAVFHMIDVADPDEPFTVFDFQDRASQIVDNLLKAKLIPIVAGGTGLYIRALIDGLNIPRSEPDKEIRERLKKEFESKGAERLHKRLSALDPTTARRLHPNDVKRVIRALEVYEQTGVSMSELIDRTKRKGSRYPDALIFGLAMDRDRLYQKIEDRVDQMLSEGLTREVESLLDKGCGLDLPSMQGLGYKEIARYLTGRCDFDTAVYELKRNTRRFAKRQYTWFRADDRIHWIDVNDLRASEVACVIETQITEKSV